MRRYRAACSILFILLAFGAAWAEDADSTSVQSNQDLTGEIGFGQPDSAQVAVADTLATKAVGERGVIDRLVLPALVSVAVGGLLLLLFTQRG